MNEKPKTDEILKDLLVEHEHELVFELDQARQETHKLRSALLTISRGFEKEPLDGRVDGFYRGVALAALGGDSEVT